MKTSQFGLLDAIGNTPLVELVNLNPNPAVKVLVKVEGVFSAEVGADFVRCVLSRGNSADPMELYRAFMGREPDLSALLVRAGLTAA